MLNWLSSSSSFWSGRITSRGSSSSSVSSGGRFLWTGFVLLSVWIAQVSAQCLSDPTLEEFFAAGSSLPNEGSCCQNDICLIPCPEPVTRPARGFGITIGVAIGISFLIGVSTYFVVAGQAENFFVAGRSLPLWIVAFTLAAQSIDSNALLGNADLSYKYHFYDGAVLPIGLGLSLILNGLFLAKHIHDDDVLTLPDVFAKRYGPTVEVLVSCCTIVSFLCLLAGNLVGMGAILSYLWDISEGGAIWLSAGLVWCYTVTGGLFSVAYTDVVQGGIGWTGCMVCAFYLIANQDPAAPPPSIGTAGYVYPDTFGDGGVCDMYAGVPCTADPALCCYNADKWCPANGTTCTADNGAYPIGDKRIFSNQMTNPTSLTPFPNALFWDWATIFILGFGNLAALDFQARCMASKTSRAAQLGCLIGGCLTFLVGIPFAYLGAITRVHYGPDSVHAEFEADTCSAILGLPTCAQWLPDPQAFIKLLTHQAPSFLGGWCLIGIVAASMSTADGAILAMGTVFSHNLMRQLDSIVPNLVTDDNLLLVARVATIPFALISTLIAAYYRSSHSAGATGYLLIVAFDVVLATVVAPLFGAFYTKKPSPVAALMAVLAGGITRVVLEFALPKDGFLLLPFQDDEFLDYGPAASDKLPIWADANATDIWDSTKEQCDQDRFRDYTGLDSLTAFMVSILTFLLFQFLENSVNQGKPLFCFPGNTPYDKKEHEKGVEVEEDKELEEEAPEKE